MSLDPTVSLEELEQRRRKASEARKASHTPKPVFETDSEAMAVINEIFNPSLKLPASSGHYTLPEELSADDLNVLQDLDISKLAELKEVFLLFDTDCDGLISKDDLRFTFTALGNEVADDFIETMLKEAKDPLDFDAFVELMSHRTSELDPEDVLLEAWSKWDDYGTGKIAEKNCLDNIEIFPYLREPVIENATQPEYTICNRTATVGSKLIHNHNNNNNNKTNASAIDVNFEKIVNATRNFDDDLLSESFIYSSQKVIGIRLRFYRPPEKIDKWLLNVTGEYGFLKKDIFQNDGRLIAGTFCDYYFFANTDDNATIAMDSWKYFHSPRYPANYPAHINCAYKFLGAPASRVEISFEELQIPKQHASCNLDKLTIFDSESANMNAVMEVICNSVHKRSIISTGPDLLIEFNASSNLTAKGFRGKFRFLNKINEETEQSIANAEMAMLLLQNTNANAKQYLEYSKSNSVMRSKNNGKSTKCT